jgi:hypothetical protein
MPRKKHDRETILETLRNHANKLSKYTLSTQEVQSVISGSIVNSYFGNIGNALEAAGLKRVRSTEHFEARGPILSDVDLFRSIAEVEKKLGYEPGFNEYVSNGKYSNKPFKRFGKWPDVIVHYRKWKAEVGVKSDTEFDSENALKNNSRQRVTPSFQTNNTPAQLYGEPIDFRGLRHAPINEQGVVYVFGMVSRELGFYIEAVQQGFPDCEGKYLHHATKNLWAKARIEFEFRASSFTLHGHDANQCDFIICWINDWPDCPIHVIELSKEILRLPAH